MLRVLSLGAGVQSSTLALMIAAGEVPMVDCAIFSDTQWEPPKVYEWLTWLERQLPFPVHRVTRGSLRDSVLAKQNANGQRFISVPWFTREIVRKRARDHLGRFLTGFIEYPKDGMGRRQCTREFKIEPLVRKKRELLGLRPRHRTTAILCETLIGISVDEVFRIRMSDEPWNRNTYPLVDRRMSRADCLAWMWRKFRRRPPRSACIICPYHGKDEWTEIMADPQLRAEVIFIDQAIRAPVRGMRGEQFMHASRKPMGTIDFSRPEDHGQIDAFNNECEGMCGV